MSEPVLTEVEENYLRSLQDSPVWNSILEKILIYRQLPKFSLKGETEKQSDHWKYHSGGIDAAEAIVSLLKCNSKQRG